MASVSIPQLKCSVPSRTVDISILYAVQKLGYDRATPEQSRAIHEFLLGRDVFVSLPTGEGKSLCYASLPLVFDWLREHYVVPASGDLLHSIVLVVSPLTSLMKDQVESFSKRGQFIIYIAISLLLAVSSIIFGGQTILSLGLRCAFVGVEQHDEAVKQAVMSGEYQLVYMSPESLLGVLQWREMFRSPVYQEGLVAIAVDEAHLVEKWYDFMTCNSLIQKTMQL